jgi:integrase
MEDALKVGRRLGLLSKSDECSRRPALPELDKLMEHFADIRRRRPSSNPMGAIIAFAIFSTRRQDEITRLAWADLDEAGSRIMVRDMKHPGQKRENHVWCDLTPEALRVINAMPKIADEIFPYNTDAISAAFTRACQFLESTVYISTTYATKAFRGSLKWVAASRRRRWCPVIGLGRR